MLVFIYFIISFYLFKLKKYIVLLNLTLIFIKLSFFIKFL